VSALNVAYRLRIHAAGTTTPSDGTVAFTIAALADVPQFGGQLIRPTEGTSQLGRWAFRALDAAGVVTANLADPATGRAHLIGRLAEVQEQRNAGAWGTVSVGRLTGLHVESDRQSSYLVEVQDERWVERNEKVFTVADTAYLWPAGLRYAWRGFLPLEDVLDGEVVAVSGSRVRLRLSSDWPISTAVTDWIRNDLKDEAIENRNDGLGNFDHLRVRVGSTDREAVSFGALTGTDFVEPLAQMDPKRRAEVSVWVYASGGLGAVGTTHQVRLWAPTAPPSPVLPLHLGTFVFLPAGPSGHAFGFRDPYELLEAIYDVAGVRYDAAAVAALKGRFPNMGWRITSPDVRVSEFVEEQIYAVTGVAPFIDDSGRVSPRSVRLPAAADFDPDAAFVLDVDNCATAPSFDHSATEVVNVITVEGRRYRSVGVQSGSADGQVGTPARPVRSDFAADFVEEHEIQDGPVEYESVTQGVGPRPVTFKAHGLASGSEASFGTLGPEWDPLLNAAKALRGETFDRFGDGPVWGKVRALRTPQDGLGRTPEDVQPGDLVKLDVATWPNMEGNVRGGVRIVQVMSRRPGARGIELEFLDAGPSLQPLATPTLTIALNAASPRHAVDLTVGTIGAGQRAQVRIGYGSGVDFHRVIDDVPAGVSVFRGLPSGTVIRAQVRRVAPGRISSAWSTTKSTTTSTLPAPTGLAVEVIGRAAKLNWTPAADGYPLMPVVRPAGSGTFQAVRERPLVPGSFTFTFPPRDASTAYDWGVRHVDEYGGLGAVASLQATTEAVGRTLVAPRNPQIAQGRTATGTEDLPPEEMWIGTGLHVRFTPAELAANTVIEVALADDFATVVQKTRVSAGVSDAVIFTPLDDAPRFVRMKHSRFGFVDSAYSSIVSALPTALLPTEVPDLFAGGTGSLRALPDGRLEATISSAGDVSTDRAYYAFVVNPDPEDYPEVDEASDFIVSGDMPWVEVLQAGDPSEDVMVAEGDLVLMRVRFWNASAGFGQDLLIRFPVFLSEPLEIVVEDVQWPRSYTFPPTPTLASVQCHLKLRVGPGVQSLHCTLVPSVGATVERDVNLTVTGGVAGIAVPAADGNPYNLWSLIDGMRTILSLDLTPYSAPGGAAGSGTAGPTARIFTNVFPGRIQGAMRALRSNLSGADAVGMSLRIGGDGAGDGLFSVDQDQVGPVIQIRTYANGGNISGSFTPNYANGHAQKWTATGNLTLQAPLNMLSGRTMSLFLLLGSHELAFGTGFFAGSGLTAADFTGSCLLYLEKQTDGLIIVGAAVGLVPL
jgi:hypothetical protein